ncbi:TPA: nucleotidyl transferase AbiEii/AbiGii toxin family protein [Providencia rettgeri]|uniref:nucleotidyl transferase AbiEii/AbiGii toxin family protein n=1 Tax=Providencia sp. PROV129 TaxID=2949839 RepID=UPI00234B6934|nr:nucleotidyl transferase AbiEii/AbiGii toxin family protein [Providencia sp. PROV129]
MSDIVNFNELVDSIVTEKDYAANRPVVEKELLHYDILYALSTARLLKHITFQGGTSLRLCYGSNRFSEDLDFAGGRDFCSAQMLEIKACIEKYVGERYGLEVVVKEPKELRKEPDYADVKVDKWQISVTTNPGKSDLPKQRIKVEITNIPAYTNTLRSLAKNYEQLPSGYSDLIIRVEDLTEVMADKLVSFPATTSHIRYRDMWDLVWLHQQGARPDAELVMKKVADYKISALFEEWLQARIESLPSLVASEEFREEMKRFLPVSVVNRTLLQPDFLEFLQATLHELLVTIQTDIYGSKDPKPVKKFEM